MEGKYFFNGKDISMNLYIQIRDVVDIIMEKSHLSFPDAMGKFYHSKTYKALLFGRNLPAILQTAITKNKKKHK